jgi:hypothetical protein
MSIKGFFYHFNTMEWYTVYKSSAFLSTVVGFFPLFVIQVDAKEIGSLLAMHEFYMVVCD